MKTIEGKELLNKIQKSLQTEGLTAESIENLKKLREIAKEEGNPTVVRTIRLIYEHLDNNQSFLVAIPEESYFEESDDEEEVKEFKQVETGEEALESLDYVLSLISSYDNKLNWEEILYYRDSLASLEE